VRAGGHPSPALASHSPRAVSHPQRSVRSLVVAVALAWPVAALLMLSAAGPANFDASASQYGLNWPGDLPRMLQRSPIETALLVAILRPWSFAHSGGRLVLALAVFVPWTLLSLAVGMHAGPIAQRHDLWLLLVCVGLAGGLVALSGTRRRAGHAAQDQSGTHR
jgi:hypothetical protein